MAEKMKLQHIQAGFAGQAFGAAADLSHCVVGNGLAPAARLRVHANNTRLTLTDALSKTFPTVAALVGNDFFAALAGAYMQAHPPRSAALIDWGATLGRFIESFEPARALPYLADMARLEWAVCESFNAVDSEPASGESLSVVTPAALAVLALPLHSAARVLEVCWPVDEIWAAHQPGAGQALEDIEMLDAPHTILVTRPHLGVYVHGLGPQAAQLAHALGAGHVLEHALNPLGEDGPEALAYLISIGAVATPLTRA